MKLLLKSHHESPSIHDIIRNNNYLVKNNYDFLH